MLPASLWAPFARRLAVDSHGTRAEARTLRERWNLIAPMKTHPACRIGVDTVQHEVSRANGHMYSGSRRVAFPLAANSDQVSARFHLGNCLRKGGRRSTAGGEQSQGPCYSLAMYGKVCSVVHSGVQPINGQGHTNGRWTHQRPEKEKEGNEDARKRKEEGGRTRMKATPYEMQSIRCCLRCC